jgi:hypothetical protein
LRAPAASSTLGCDRATTVAGKADRNDGHMGFGSVRRATLTEAVVVALAVALGVLFSACHDAPVSADRSPSPVDPYVGTWTIPDGRGGSIDYRIERSGDGYTVSDASGESKERLEGTVKDGILVVPLPDTVDGELTFEPQGDDLRFFFGQGYVTLTRKD